MGTLSLENLPEELYGVKFEELGEAIENSVKKGMLKSILERKEKGIEDKNLSYIRIAFGNKDLNSPGNPFVIEIWPANHYSPIHNHSDTHSMIKVWRGELFMSLYPILSTCNLG